MFKLSSTPTVSCVVFPARTPATEEPTEVFLSTSEDYSVGKMVRSGRDAVHGIGKRGARVYDSTSLRRYLFQVDDHLKWFKRTHPECTLGVRQGHGNIGMNNWAVAYVQSSDGPELIVPRGEVLHERLYPSFLKTGAPSAQSGTQSPYDIADLLYVWVGPTDADDTVSPESINRQITEEPDREIEPDREMHDDVLYLPVWGLAPLLEGTELEVLVTDSGQRINWPTNTRFIQIAGDCARSSRNCRGTVDAKHIRAVPMLQAEKIAENQDKVEAGPRTLRYRLGHPVHDLCYAFFGIPVQTLAPRRAPGRSGRFFAALDDIVHYFYDLRHVFDLAPIPDLADLGLEYNLFEDALKAAGFSGAHRMLRGGRPRRLEIDIGQLRDKLDADADPAVRNKLDEFRTKPADIGRMLTDKGYKEVTSPDKVKDPGQFHVVMSGASHPKTTLYVVPERDTYSYSFIGLVRGRLKPAKGEAREPQAEDETLVVLAVTHGISGIRPGTIGAKRTFSAPLEYGFHIEEAVAKVEQQLSLMLEQHFEFHANDDAMLLLLDQGGDVHQWIGAGKVGPVVGSSEGRSFMSAELIVARCSKP